MRHVLRPEAMFPLGVALLALAGGAGCEPNRSCTEDVTTLSSASAVEDGSPVADLLALVVGEQRLTMDYEEFDSAFIDVDPPEASTELVLSLSYEGGEARFVNWTQRRETNEEGEEVSCESDRLEVDAVARLRSADGLLDEAFEGTLRRGFRDDGTTTDEVRFDVAVDPDELQGSATIVDVHPEDPETIEYGFTARFDGENVRGSWHGALSYENYGAWVTIATWCPLDASCDREHSRRGAAAHARR